MRVLLIEDEEKLAQIVSRGLKAEGFAVDAAKAGGEGFDLAMSYAYDVIILDIMLPEMSGTDILRAVRQKNRAVPILVLTARDAIADKVKHLEAGADDYITKPFAFSELLVRIRALLRRAPLQRNDLLTASDLEVDRLARLVRRAGKRIDLSAKEFALLEYLIQNKGRVLSRTMIIEHVWDQAFEGLTNIVDVYIRQLRAKLDEGYPTKIIRTVRGVGYVVDDDGT
jgi:two-component system copper resistance phosphate regulon response regulator CusR